MKNVRDILIKNTLIQLEGNDKNQSTYEMILRDVPTSQVRRELLYLLTGELKENNES